MAKLVWNDVFIQSIETALKTGAAAPDFATCTIDLFSNPIQPNRNDISSMYTVVNFTGYAQLTLTPTGPYVDGVNGPYLQSQLLTWLCTGTANLDTALGLYIRTAAGLLVCSMLFDSPAQFQSLGATLSMVLQLRLRDYP